MQANEVLATPAKRGGIGRFLTRSAPGMTPDEAAAYAESARIESISHGKLFMAVIGGINFCCIATDPLFNGESERALNLLLFWRPIISLGAVLTVIAFHLCLRFRTVPLPLVAAVSWGSVVGTAAFLCGEIGPPSTPWIHFLYITGLLTYSLACSLRTRTAVQLAMTGGMAIGYFGFHPAYWHAPFALSTVSGMAYFTVSCIWVGELYERSRQQTFLLRRAIARQAEELQAWNGQLEHRVDEQTRELRTLTARRESVREEERRHIARELHDELGQELSALRYALSVTEKRHQKDPTTITANLKDLASLLARTTRTTRHLVTDLRPRVLDDLGLSAAAEWLVRDAKERTGIDARLVMPPTDLKLPDTLAVAAFRILQESLTNVTKHAQAKTVEITLASDGVTLDLSVIDDGIGIVAEGSESRRNGMGLVGMRERARAFGGDLSIEPGPVRGTIVRAHLPLDQSTASAA